MDLWMRLPYEEQMHCRRVSAVSAFLAKAAGSSPQEVRVVAQSALLHDVGKLALPQELIRKSTPLTRGEQTILLTHTLLGRTMLKDTQDLLDTAAVVAYQHHERLDGSGYLGLHDGNIHPHAKLVAIADLFDSLAFCREPWDMEQVRTELRQRSGRRLAAGIVCLLLDNIRQIYGICNEINTQTPVNAHS